MRLPRPLLLAATAAVLLLAGCDDGPVGPVGPPGPPGPGTDVYAVSFDFFLDAAGRDGLVYSEQYDVPGINQNVVRDGAVLVYYRFAGTWTAMPYAVSVEAPDDPPRVDYAATLGYAYDTGFLEVFVEASTDDDAVWEALETSPLFEETLPMKAVIIEGIPLGKVGVDVSDYEAVARRFGLDGAR